MKIVPWSPVFETEYDGELAIVKAYCQVCGALIITRILNRNIDTDETLSEYAAIDRNRFLAHVSGHFRGIYHGGKEAS